MPEQDIIATASGRAVGRSNWIAESVAPNANNWGHGLTQTLTENLFQRSFGDWGDALGRFSPFFWAPRKVVGAGIKNIQVGIKTARPYMAYAVGDMLQLFIDNRTKIYESRIGDLKVKLQVSLDLPPNWHVDKFINFIEYRRFIEAYKHSLSESMSFTIYEMLKVMFISSAFEMCLPDYHFDKFLLSNLLPETLGPSPNPQQHPALQTLFHNADTVKALVDELRQKITNCYVFDVSDFIAKAAEDGSKKRFNPFNVWDEWSQNAEDKQKALERVLAAGGVIHEADQGGGPCIQNSREESLKAFSIALSTILSDIINGDPKARWWQGNRGNIWPEDVYDEKKATSSKAKAPRRLKKGKKVSDKQSDDAWEKDVYPDNRGTSIMNKEFHERPTLMVKSSKDNLILIMSQEDYNDFVEGDYEGYFGQQSMAVLNFKNSVLPKVSQVITIPGMVGGHAIIMDKRMFAIIPHLEHTGTDTLNQRLATVETMHRWFIFGMFDQFVGVRIQMVGYNARPIDVDSVFFEHRKPADVAPRQ